MRVVRVPAPLLAALALLLLPPSATAQYLAQRVTTGLVRPILVTAPPSDPRLFIVEQGGRVRIWDGASLSTFLDLSSAVSNGNEQGLLGLAFPPDHATTGLFYVDYTDVNGDTVISRFQVGPDPDLADPLSEEVLFTVSQPFANHNGGHLAFGPNDGYLYVSLGDGGFANDPLESGQDLSTPLGKILRIDVSAGTGFAIPPSNPFVGVAGADERIWALGLRNPYRFSFDRSTGDLWIADVGQNAVEEIDLQPSSSAGGENYGWDCYEGSQSFEATSCPPAGTLTFPVMEYGHDLGLPFYAVIGGYRYRGPEPSLAGLYFFGDNGGLLFTGTEVSPGVFQRDIVSIATDLGSIDNVSGFGEDAAGNVYLVDLFDGELFRLVAGVTAGCPTTPNPACREDALQVVVARDLEAPSDPNLSGPRAKLRFRWVRGGSQGSPVSQLDFGNPTTGDDVYLCGYQDGVLTSSLRAPGGGAAWKTLGSRGYRYADKTLAQDGLQRLVLLGGPAGRARIVVAAKGSALPLPAFPFSGSSWVYQVHSDGSAQCWAGSLGPPDVLKNLDKGVFRARRQGP